VSHIVLHSDGGARGNPGPAAIGIVVELERDGMRELLEEIAETIGVATNNVAEYRALIRGLEEASRVGGTEVTCLLDSQLVVQQLNGRYKVKHPNVVSLHQQAEELARQFKRVTYRYVPRAENAEADRLVNAALDGNPAGSGGWESPRPDPAGRPGLPGANAAGELLAQAYRDAVEIPRRPLERINQVLPASERYASEAEARRARWAIAEALAEFAANLGLVDREELARLANEFGALRPG
jgi:ribonuclease H / adenosylcobalamin/alpha-ribazole phosphatase